MAQLRKPAATSAKRSQSVSGSKASPARAAKKPAPATIAAYPAEVFASAAAYDQAVAIVVAHIHSGQVAPRQPDL